MDCASWETKTQDDYNETPAFPQCRFLSLTIKFSLASSSIVCIIVISSSPAHVSSFQGNFNHLHVSYKWQAQAQPTEQAPGIMHMQPRLCFVQHGQFGPWFWFAQQGQFGPWGLVEEETRVAAADDKALLPRENVRVGAKALPTARHVKGRTNLDWI